MKSKKIESRPEVKRFLDDVCKHIRGADRKKQVCEEILSHLEAELDGVETDFEESLRSSLGKFGDPGVLGHSLYIAQRTWPQTLVKYAATSVLVGSAFLYLTSSYFVGHYQEVLKKTNDVVASRIPRFELAQKEIAGFSLLAETSAVKSDAGAFLNSKIQWSGQNQISEITVPEILDAKWNKGWLTADIPLALKKTDLDWIAKLKDFDHWDLFVSGPNARLIGEDPVFVNPYACPLPEFGFLSRAVRLHLRRALDRGDISSALDQVRHLARLVYTTETLIGSMEAVSILKMERAAYDEAWKRGIIVSSTYEPISSEALAKMKTTLWVTAGFADFAAPNVLARVFLDAKSQWPMGSCGALAETAQAVVLTSNFLKKKYPFEADMNEQHATIRRVFEASKPYCRLSFHRQLMSRTQEYSNFIFGFKNFSLATNWWGQLENYRYVFGQYLPYARQGMGMELMVVARPDFTRRYAQE
ncbi:MAG: hypothetical protein H7235_06955 [Bdellovibrionaceae bacterium]|nr:hypothetical protein [Pseudobdellovibrionaceae bacterium]